MSKLKIISSNIEQADSKLKIGIAGSFSKNRDHHAKYFETAFDLLDKVGVKCILGDDSSDPDTAESLARFFVSNVDLVIGHFSSECALRVAPIYREKRVRLLLPASTSSSIDEGSYITRLCSDDKSQVAEVIKRVESLNEDNLSIDVITDDTFYAQKMLSIMENSKMPFDARFFDIESSVHGTSNIVVLFTVAKNTIRYFNQLHHIGAEKTIILSDESDIKEVYQASKKISRKCHFISATPSFGDLLVNSCEVLTNFKTQVDNLTNDTVDSMLKSKWKINIVN